jgi:hypothetical protein
MRTDKPDVLCNQVVLPYGHGRGGAVHPPASIATEVAARQRRRDRRRRVVSLTATATALGTAAGVIAIVPGHSSPGVGRTGSAAGKRPAIKLTADQRVLYRLGVVAARQPQPNGRYAVMSTEGDDVKDTSVIDSLTGNMWSYQEGTDGSPSGKGPTRHYSPTAAQFAAMPTDLSALRAALITQWDNQNKPVESPLLKALRAAHHPIPLPVPVSDDDKVFQQASDILWNPLVGSALRSALYKVLAAVPGVTVNPTARDSTGQPAVEISRLDASGRPGGKSDGDIYATYESPATGATLESTITYPPGSGVVTPQDPNGDDTVVDTTAYLKVTWASTIPADPYDG